METKGLNIILASGSPRRQRFFEEMDIPFSIKVIPVVEEFPDNLKGAEIAQHIVKQKAAPFHDLVKDNELIITADTIVWNKNQCLGKPVDDKECYATPFISFQYNTSGNHCCGVFTKTQMGMHTRNL
jgi:septum formation protein